MPPEPVFARIVVRETLLGRLAAALFRPSALTFDDGRMRHNRFIPALGAGGFLLSPAIASVEDCAALAFGEAGGLDAKPVTVAAISASQPAGPFYEPVITVSFQPIALPRVVPDTEARPFYDALIRRQRQRVSCWCRHTPASRSRQRASPR